MWFISWQSIVRAVWKFCCLKIISRVKWEWIFGKTRYQLTDAELDDVRRVLIDEHCIILIRRRAHLTTWLLSLSELILRKRTAYWSHCALNLDNEVNKDSDFRIAEAIAGGVIVSPFMQVFNCDSVVLLRPRAFTSEDWEAALWAVAQDVGKPYDSLFDFCDDTEMSCSELIRDALRATPGYYGRFPVLEHMLWYYGKLTPQMIYESGEFDVVLEFRH